MTDAGLPPEPDLFALWFEYTIVLDALKKKAAQLRGQDSVLLDGVASDLEGLLAKFGGCSVAESQQKVRALLDVEIASRVEAEAARLVQASTVEPPRRAVAPSLGAGQRTVAALVLLLAEGSSAYRHERGANVRAIAEDAARAALRARYGDPVPAGASIPGLSEETVRKVIGAAMSEFDSP